MRALIIGNNGQVGWELERLLRGSHDIVAADFPAIDLTNADALRSLVREVKPRIIFNAAAYTAVDRAEEEPERVMQINAEAPRVIAEAARELGAGLVHYSTDYVYDGTKNGLYTEDDALNPQSAYGRSKASGDAAIAAIGGEYAILRTSWVYGSRGKNFVRTMLRLGAERNELRIVDDQIGSPTWCRHLAEASIHAAEQMISGEWPSGVYNATNSGYTSWCGFAEEIFRLREARTGLASPKLVPISSAEYPLPAPRPLNSRLSSERFARQFGRALPTWQQALASVIGEIAPEELAGRSTTNAG